MRYLRKFKEMIFRHFDFDSVGVIFVFVIMGLLCVGASHLSIQDNKNINVLSRDGFSVQPFLPEERFTVESDQPIQTISHLIVKSQNGGWYYHAFAANQEVKFAPKEQVKLYSVSLNSDKLPKDRPIGGRAEFLLAVAAK